MRVLDVHFFETIRCLKAVSAAEMEVKPTLRRLEYITGVVQVYSYAFSSHCHQARAITVMKTLCSLFPADGWFYLRIRSCWHGA